MCTVQRPSLVAKTEKFFVYEEKKFGRIGSSFEKNLKGKNFNLAKSIRATKHQYIFFLLSLLLYYNANNLMEKEAYKTSKIFLILPNLRAFNDLKHSGTN